MISCSHVHFLTLIKEVIGFDNLAKKVVNPLKGRKIGAYYGCLLLRPSSELARFRLLPKDKLLRNIANYQAPQTEYPMPQVNGEHTYQALSPLSTFKTKQ